MQMQIFQKLHVVLFRKPHYDITMYIYGLKQSVFNYLNVTFL